MGISLVLEDEKVAVWVRGKRSGLTEEMVVGVSLVFEGETSIADMVQVLEPLKVGHCHTTGVQVHVLGEGETHTGG